MTSYTASIVISLNIPVFAVVIVATSIYHSVRMRRDPPLFECGRREHFRVVTVSSLAWLDLRLPAHKAAYYHIKRINFIVDLPGVQPNLNNVFRKKYNCISYPIMVELLLSSVKFRNFQNEIVCKLPTFARRTSSRTSFPSSVKMTSWNHASFVSFNGVSDRKMSTAAV